MRPLTFDTGMDRLQSSILHLAKAVNILQQCVELVDLDGKLMRHAAGEKITSTVSENLETVRSHLNKALDEIQGQEGSGDE